MTNEQEKRDEIAGVAYECTPAEDRIFNAMMARLTVGVSSKCTPAEEAALNALTARLQHKPGGIRIGPPIPISELAEDPPF